MSILIEVARELFSMFVADAGLTVATLVLLVVVAAAMHWLALGPMAAGGLLLAGSVVILIEAAVRQARARRK